ncbi:glycosyltransferase family 31 protein [Annulohypoxylon bovei var. microspora]|nr:glycosyltransferase family 31 protein [Annulohypoxylon bovei var. microspora]
MFRSIAPYGRARTFQILAVFLVFCTLLSTLRLYGRQPPPPSIYDYTDGKTRGALQNETESAKPPSDETAYLRYLVREYGLTNEVPWFARRIRVQFDARARKSMTEISGSRFATGDFQRVRTDDERLNLHVESPVTVSVTRSATPDQVDASSLLFGISTSYDRLMYGNSSLLYDWVRWLTDGKGASNGASLVLTLHHATTPEINHISGKLSDIGIDAVVLPAESAQDSTTRYLDLVHLLTQRKDELQREGHEKKFFALVDDDVFFPSLGKLLARLGKYSPRKKFYIGLPSEQADWTVENNVTLTYGGGAVFLTPPMADSVSQLPCLNATAPPSSAPQTGQWDAALYTCLTTHTTTQLHILPSLYHPLSSPAAQYAGTSYASGAQPLTLHHYKHRHLFAPSKSHLITSLCGESCFLQRFLFKPDGWILVSGHSISAYPDGVAVATPPRSSGEKARVSERLVVDKADDAPDRKVVSWAGTKRTWRLLDARVEAGGAVWQAYVKRRGAPAAYADEDDRVFEEDRVHTQDGPADVDSVIVLIWEPGP